MTENHDNRRVTMTKLLIKNALLELLEHKELSNISITAICETADVHRSTFYKYYSTTADLLREIEQDYLDRIPVPPQTVDHQNQESLLETNTIFFDYVKENGKSLRILFDRSEDNSFASRMVEYLSSGYIPVGEQEDEQASRFVRLYIANGTVGMLREWINADFPVSSRKIAEMMYFLSKKVIS
ncbi:MAG: TetR/AcrR family transcriptional regulator [Anaerolineaceae bacterium]|nr:TetR/AcrR family transcriptional regulator [Anaerolineaceae bacterium]MBQ6520530.1 TetR/AcrR family transcriptional regulator [Anaerolineaceae bacterium]